jgi:signal transduction histidine kinase/DNA-binding response OmpR family regulator
VTDSFFASSYFKFFFILFITLLISAKGHAQYYSIEQCIEKLDSGYLSIKTWEEDSLLMYSCQLYLNKGPIDQSKAELAASLGYVYQELMERDSAAAYFDLGFRFYRSLQDSLMTAHMLYALGGSHQDNKKFQLSVETYIKALRYYQALNLEEDMADTYNALGNNYYYAGDPNIAINYYQKAISYFETHIDTEQLAIIYDNYASVLIELEQYDSSAAVYQKSIAILLGTGFTDLIISTYQGLGILKIQQKEFPSAYYYFVRALELSKEYEDAYLLADSHQFLGSYYLEMEIYDSAVFYANRALEIDGANDNYLIRINASEILHKAYAHTGDYQRAYKLLDVIREEVDSLFTLNLARQINTSAIGFDTEKTEKELNELTVKVSQMKFQLRTARSLSIIMLVIILTIAVTALLIYRNVRIKTRVSKLLQKKNDEILEESEQLKKAEESRSKWFINVAHELRTPLSLIKGPIHHISEQESLTVVSEKLLKIVDRNVDQLERLIGEVLDLSKMEAGMRKLQKVNVHLTDWLEIQIKKFGDFADDRRILINIDSAKRDIWVQLDVNMFSKVIGNLLHNAIKFSEDESDILVGFGLEQNKILITVADTGIGIPSSELPFIFDRFYQVDNASKQYDLDTGTGIGLSLCKEIVGLHGGRILAESKIGKGTVFKIELPESLLLVKDAILKKESSQSVYRSRSVLVVEDNPDMHEFVDSILSENFDLSKMMNAHDALMFLEDYIPSLIITDLMMPKMDGVLFIERIKRNPLWADIPIIVISAVTDEKQRLDLLRTGINEYLTKPFNPEEFRIKVGNILASSAKRKLPVGIPKEDSEVVSFEKHLSERLEQRVKEHIADFDFSVTRLAEEVGLSERQLYRYIKQHRKITPATFIREVRLQRAFELARINAFQTTAELSYAVGFQHPSYFATVFKKRFGKKPSDYLKEKANTGNS